MKTKDIVIGLSPLVVLLITFIVLKLCNVVDWPWYGVLAPAWAPVIIYIGSLSAICFFELVINSANKLDK